MSDAVPQSLELPDEPWVAIMVNPYSGARPSHEQVERLEAALAREGFATRLFRRHDEYAAVLNHPDLPRHCRCVVIAGGDGTVADVLSAHPPVPVAVLPLGLENLFARHFGFDRDIDALARRIARGHTTRLDLGKAAGRCFSLMAGVGIDGDVVHRVAQWRRHAHGLHHIRRLSYALPIVRGALAYDYPIVTLEADGRRVTGAHAWVFNLPQYAMGIPLGAAARQADGLLFWLVLTRPGLLSLAGYTIDILLNRHLRREDALHGYARRVRLDAERPVPVQIDGDAAGFTPVDLSVEPSAVRVIAP